MPSEGTQQTESRPIISAHQKRWLTSGVAIPGLVLVLLKGGEAGFAFLFVVGAGVSLWEYYALVLPGQALVSKGIGLMLGLAITASCYTQDIRTTFCMLTLAFMGSAVLCLAQFRPRAVVVDVLSRYVLGFVYIPFLLGHLILIRNSDTGLIWTCFLFVVVFAGDTFAFYVGKAVGRHRLSPSISPGKTVEGAAGGLVGNLLIGALFKQYWLPELNWGSCICLLILLGVMEQVGDLVESMLKRSAGLKDSGRFLPGHGGMLDRLDGLLFAAPALYYIKIYVL